MMMMLMMMNTEWWRSGVTTCCSSGVSRLPASDVSRAGRILERCLVRASPATHDNSDSARVLTGAAVNYTVYRKQQRHGTSTTLCTENNSDMPSTTQCTENNNDTARVLTGAAVNYTVYRKQQRHSARADRSRRQLHGVQKTTATQRECWQEPPSTTRCTENNNDTATVS